MKGIIVENSLKDPRIIDELEVLRSWKDGSWKLYEVEISLKKAESLAPYLKDGPWYMHFCDTKADIIVVVFKDKTFTLKHSDMDTWLPAIEYGKLIGIPGEQLDFLTE